jgi:hypothetical protein
VHVAPGPQTLPHVPQFVLLTVVHALLQTICPAGHGWHWPFTQFCPPAHACPHEPQLFGSVAVDVHTPGLEPQTICPFGHG